MGLSISSISQTSASFSVSLSNQWNQDNYVQIVISTGSGFSGGITTPSPSFGSASAPSSGASYSVSGGLSGLSANTSYTMYAYAQSAQDGRWYSQGSASFTTIDYPPPPTPLSTPSITSVVPKYKSVDIVLSNVFGAENYAVEIYRVDNGAEAGGAVSSSTSITISGLSVGVSYRVRAQAQDTNGSNSNSSWSVYTTFMTLSAPSAPQFDTNQTTKGNGSVSLVWSNVSYATNYEVNYCISDSGTWNLTSTFSVTSGTVSSLINGQPYDFRVRAYVPDYGGYTGYSGVVTGTPGLRPQNWLWTSIMSQGQPISISATEWNDFCNRIRDFQVYKGITPTTFTSVSSGTTISASIVNATIIAISGMSPSISPPTQATSGVTVITSAFFNLLKDSLNSIL